MQKFKSCKPYAKLEWPQHNLGVPGWFHDVFCASAFDIGTCRLWNFLPAHDLRLTYLKQYRVWLGKQYMVTDPVCSAKFCTFLHDACRCFDQAKGCSVFQEAAEHRLFGNQPAMSAGKEEFWLFCEGSSKASPVLQGYHGEADLHGQLLARIWFFADLCHHCRDFGRGEALIIEVHCLSLSANLFRP